MKYQVGSSYSEPYGSVSNASVAASQGVTAKRDARSASLVPIRLARTQVYIHELGVDSDARRREVGTALLCSRSLASQSGIARIGVDVFVRNEDAVNFYESRGFATEREVRWLVAVTLPESNIHLQ